MFVKELKKTKRLVKAEALLNRLHADHPKWQQVKSDVIKLQRGFNGERSLAYYLQQIPEKDCYIFHNLRLPLGTNYFQIDFFILTSHFALIPECKNFFGNLFFEKNFKQLIRTANGQEEGFSDPITQAKWHKLQLGRWMIEHHFPIIPIEFLVVIADPSTIITTDANHFDAKRYVVHNQIFLERFLELDANYTKEHSDKKTLKKLTKQLLKEHQEEDSNILKRYSISESELIKGVQCPSCSAFGMIRLYGYWYCRKCHHKCKDAHRQALSDYFLLVRPTITNKQSRNFLQLEQEDSATYLLKTMNLPYSGSTKGRIYYQPDM